MHAGEEVPRPRLRRRGRPCGPEQQGPPADVDDPGVVCRASAEVPEPDVARPHHRGLPARAPRSPFAQAQVDGGMSGDRRALRQPGHPHARRADQRVYDGLEVRAGHVDHPAAGLRDPPGVDGDHADDPGRLALEHVLVGRRVVRRQPVEAREPVRARPGVPAGRQGEADLRQRGVGEGPDRVGARVHRGHGQLGIRRHHRRVGGVVCRVGAVGVGVRRNEDPAGPQCAGRQGTDHRVPAGAPPTSVVRRPRPADDHGVCIHGASSRMTQDAPPVPCPVPRWRDFFHGARDHGPPHPSGPRRNRPVGQDGSGGTSSIESTTPSRSSTSSSGASRVHAAQTSSGRPSRSMTHAS